MTDYLRKIEHAQKDKSRNTFKYRGYDISVEYDANSVSNLSFMIPDRSLPNSFFSFAYFDELDEFISSGLNWDKFMNK